MLPNRLVRFPRPVVLFFAVIASCTSAEGVRRGYLQQLALTLPAPTTPAVVIPGFGVSRLVDPRSGRNVWGTPRSVVRTSHADDLDLPWDGERGRFGRDGLVARGFSGSRGPINTAWHLSEALRRYGGYRASYERSVRFEEATVYPFAWDWRLSFDETTADLDSFIERIRRTHGDPSMKVDLVTHSAGAAPALLYLRIGTAALDAPEQWTAAGARARAKIRRLVLVAPPRQGVTDPLRVAVQPERFVRRTFLPELVATWPSLPQLLPREGRFVVDEQGSDSGADLHRLDGWQQLEAGLFDSEVRARVIRSRGSEAYQALVAGFARSLALAGSFRKAMAMPMPGAVEITVIAGDCVETPKAALRRADGSFAFYRRQLRAGEQNLAPLLLEPGDGTIPISSATYEGAEPVERFCTGHQSLAADPSVHRAILRALLGR